MIDVTVRSCTDNQLAIEMKFPTLPSKGDTIELSYKNGIPKTAIVVFIKWEQILKFPDLDYSHHAPVVFVE